MNGWQRIGVVLAFLLGVPTYLIAYETYDSAYGNIYPSAEVKALKGQDFWDALYKQAETSDPDRYEGCILSSVKMQGAYSQHDKAYSVSCDKTVTHAFEHSILWALLPGLVLWLAGLTVAWVAAGFRTPTRASIGK
jgi:hypothetical protein